MFWHMILFCLTAIAATVIMIVVSWRYIGARRLLVLVLLVGMFAGFISSRKRYEGLEARNRMISLNPAFLAEERESLAAGITTSYTVVEWNFVRGSLVGNAVCLAGLGLLVLFSRKEEDPG